MLHRKVIFRLPRDFLRSKTWSRCGNICQKSTLAKITFWVNRKNSTKNRVMYWGAPTPSTCHHQDSCIFSRGSLVYFPLLYIHLQSFTSVYVYACSIHMSHMTSHDEVQLYNGLVWSSMNLISLIGLDFGRPFFGWLGNKKPKIRCFASGRAANDRWLAGWWLYVIAWKNKFISKLVTRQLRYVMHIPVVILCFFSTKCLVFITIQSTAKPCAIP